jgi:hypothetical protein
MAACLIPTLGFFLVIKPNLGLASLASFPSKKALTGCAILVIISLLFQPSWPLAWLHAIRERNEVNYKIPLLLPGGFFLLAALFRWRRSEGRLLLAMSIIPQSLLFYDQLLLWLIPKTTTESAILGITSYIGWFIATLMVGNGDATAFSRIYGPALLMSIYLPCLVMLLRRPNEFASASLKAHQSNPQRLAANLSEPTP